jgi:heat shock protein HtpX
MRSKFNDKNFINYKRSNLERTFFIFFFFLLIVIGLGWIFSVIFQSPDILYVAVIFSVLMSVVSYWYSDKIAIASAHAKLASEAEIPEVYEIVRKLTKKDNLPMMKIYISPEEQINAFATGRNPSHAAVAVTRGALEKLNNEELEGVLAHELSHVKNYDMLVSTVVIVLAGFISLLANWLQMSFFFGGFSNNRNNRDNDNNLMMIIGLLVAFLAPIGASLIQLAISRKRESLADISGANLSGKPLALASALKKIENDDTPMTKVNPATAHLWISDPNRGRKISSWEKLFMTHPPITERIEALKKLAK